MAPSDGTLTTGRAESTSFARITPSDPVYSQRKISRLSLNRKRPRNVDDGQQEHRQPSPLASDHINVIPSKKIREDIMNGHNHHKILESGRFSGSSNSGAKSVSSTSSSCHTSIASLCNLGNTCFLNSVLYTLRFTPGFLHNLHHLVADLGIGSNKDNKDNKRGRSNGSTGNTNNSSLVDVETERAHDVIEQLHELFRNMSSSDDHLIERDASINREPIPPSNLLHAVGKMNSLFEGNQQQDAHELLIALLTMLRDIKIPTAIPQQNSAASEDDGVDISSHKKADKKKGRKSLLISNYHSSSVKLVSSNPKADGGGGGGGGVTSPNGGPGEDPSVETTQEAIPNFVRENFVGKTVFRTKCLECETSTYRSDKFINIDIPLTFDDDLSETMSNGFLSDATDNGSGSRSNGGSASTLSVADLFLKQIMASETLRENNKYLCAECSRLNEAQRSVQYELLPKVLVLQLKRFTAATNKSAFMSKINDFIPTPFTMNCFCIQCLPPDSPLHPPGEQRLLPPKHHYRLFAVIMHLGATVASGHYIAYVRASVDLNIEYSRCARVAQSNNGSLDTNQSTHQQQQQLQQPPASRQKGGGGSSSGGNSKKGIMKYFTRNNDSSKNGGLPVMNASTNGVDGGQSGTGGSLHCRSANCCGMQRVLCQLNSRDMPHPKYRQRSQESLNSSSSALNGGGGCSGPLSSETDSTGVSNGGGPMEELWLECDDENISVIPRRQFEDELNSKQGATTPYLLFYERV